MAATKPQKNSLNICLTESVVFLRSSDFSGRRQAATNAATSVLRGLLTLELAKPTRISSIEIELQGKTATVWPEGVGARRTEITEEHKLFSATQVFFRAPTTPTFDARRTLSVGPGLSFYRDEYEPREDTAPPRRTQDAPDYSLFHTFVDSPVAEEPVERGRDRTRRRLSAESTYFHREVAQHHVGHQASRSPTPVYSPVASASGHGTSDGLHSPSNGSMSQFSSLRRFEQNDVNRSLSRPPSSHPTSRQPSVSRTRPPPASSSSSFRDYPSPSLSRTISHDEPSTSSAGASHTTATEQVPASPVSPVHTMRREDSTEDRRGRRTARFSLAAVSNSILDAVKERVRSRSPMVERADDRSKSRGRINDKGKDKEVTKDHGKEKGKDKEKDGAWHFLEHKVGEVFHGEDHKEYGDGWREFKKGTYTFPISFAIPANMPPTLDCDHGSVTWRLKAQVHRPGAFSAKFVATRDVILVACPGEDDTEDTENIVVERFWDNQLQYLLTVSGRMFHIGAKIPITMNFLPMAKMKIHRLSIILEERVDYYVQMKRVARTDLTNRFPLLNIKHTSKNVNIPAPHILPLDSDDPLAFENSPLKSLLSPDDDPSEFASSLLGPGPWSFHTQLQLPSACGLLHFTNLNKRSNIQIHHTLKIVVRVERGDDLHIDPKTGRRKLFDIVVQTPVHILSCLCSSDYTSLPRYSQDLDTTLFPPQVGTCNCSVKRRGQTIAPPRHSPVTSSSAINGSSSGLERAPTRASSSSESSASIASLTMVPPPNMTQARLGSLYDRNIMFERLITGQQSEMGESPPGYEFIESIMPVEGLPVESVR